MPTYQCRFTAPRSSGWSAVEAPSPEMAANEFHYRDKSFGISYCPDPEKPGSRIYFASVEVDGFGTWVSRVYWSGIVRRGGVRSRGRKLTLADVAKAVRWERDPAELLGEGWDGEESEWR